MARILFLGSSSSSKDLLQELKDAGHDTIVCASPSAFAEAVSVPPALMLVDLLSSEGLKTTYEATKRLVSCSPSLPVLVLSDLYPGRDVRRAETFLRKVTKATILRRSLLYGDDATSMFSLMLKAIREDITREVPIPSPSSNVVPAIHVRDYRAVIVGAIANLLSNNSTDSSGASKDIIAADASSASAEDILKALAGTFGVAGVRRMSVEETRRSAVAADHSMPRISTSPLMRVETLSKEDLARHHRNAVSLTEDIVWHSKDGVIRNIERCTSEFLASHGIQPVRIAVIAPNEVDTTALTKALSDCLALRTTSLAEAKAELESATDDEGEEKETAALRDRVKKADASDSTLMRDLLRRQTTRSRELRRDGWILNGSVESVESAESFLAEISTRPDLVLAYAGVEKLADTFETSLGAEQVIRLDVDATLSAAKRRVAPAVRALFDTRRPTKWRRSDVRPDRLFEDETKIDEPSHEATKKPSAESKVDASISEAEIARDDLDRRVAEIRRSLSPHLSTVIAKALHLTGEKRPDDPIKYLAETLLRESKNGISD